MSLDFCDQSLTNELVSITSNFDTPTLFLPGKGNSVFSGI